MSEHTHRFRLLMHMDGCHWYRSHLICDCGATVHTYDERSVDEDPYSAIWMEPMSDEPCQRCGELLAGAEPVHKHECLEAPKGVT